MSHSMTDHNGSRLTLCQKNASGHFNWLFIPGGPGMDSEYLDRLIGLLDLPGNVWRLDLPENGSNYSGTLHNPDLDFEEVWKRGFLEVVNTLDNIVLVGHSFGAMYPLIFPEIADKLKGYIVLNSAPSLWRDKAVEKASTKGIPPFTKELAAFEKDPSPETFKTAFSACMPYYFAPEFLEEGREYFTKGQVNYHAASWWLVTTEVIQFTAQWIPKCPMLIIGGSEDCCTPIESYQEDKRFDLPNVTLHEIQGAGHTPWVEKPEQVKALFTAFVAKYFE